MEHSDRCNPFQSCEDCYDKHYSFDAVIRQLEDEADDKYLKSKLARLKYNNSNEAKESKKRRFTKRFGIVAHEYKVTKGEKLLRLDKRLGKWRVVRGQESGLRRVWTIIRESSVGLEEKKSKVPQLQVAELQDVEMSDRVEADSVESEESGCSSGSPKD